jgi:hypothetical protein
MSLNGSGVGHSNGHTNGYPNGHTNGHHTSGDSKGTTMERRIGYSGPTNSHLIVVGDRELVVSSLADVPLTEEGAKRILLQRESELTRQNELLKASGFPVPSIR